MSHVKTGRNTHTHKISQSKCKKKTFISIPHIQYLTLRKIKYEISSVWRAAAGAWEVCWFITILTNTDWTGYWGQWSPLILVEVQRRPIFRELHSVATSSNLCHKKPARRIQSSIVYFYRSKRLNNYMLLSEKSAGKKSYQELSQYYKYRLYKYVYRYEWIVVDKHLQWSYMSVF